MFHHMQITFFGSIEIANHFMDSTGLVGDTIVFMYVVDLEIEKKYYRQMEPYSCPQDAYDIIHRSRAGDPYENE